jgi:hypothetical protein
VLPGYTNGHKYLYEGGAERKTYSDLDASWSHRSAVSAREAGRLLRLQAPPGRVRRDKPAAGVADGDGQGGRVQLRGAAADAVKARGFRPEVAVLDMGYDHEVVYSSEQRDCRPVIPLRETPAVKAGKHKPPTCEHGEWTFAGSDVTTGQPRGCCLTAECSSASRWIGAGLWTP